MALGDSFSRALIGRPSLRRQLRGVDASRLAQFDEMNADAKNFKGLYRQRLAEFAKNEAAAQPMQDRAALEEALKTPGLDPAKRDQLQERLRRNQGGFGSAAARFDPYNYGSVAQREFGSLYRR